MELLIKNADIVDGTGRAARKGSIGVVNGKIILDPAQDTADLVINADGLILSPGFIDSHSHGDGIYGTDFGQLCKTNQGVTTEVCGQCGSSMFPVNADTLPVLKELLSLITSSFPEEMKEFDSFAAYKKYLSTLKLTANTALFVGHGAIRTAVMGFENRKANPGELEKMKTYLREAMDEGALGMSTGLVYAPGSFADTEELVELAKVLAEYDGIYASHLRNESGGVVEAVREAIEIGRRAGVRVQISHHKAYGKKNWGKSRETLALVAEATARGQIVSIDQYPYEASMTHINQLLPPQYFSHGFAEAAKLLEDPAEREKAKAMILDENCTFDNYYQNCGGMDRIFAAVLPETPQFNGMFISEIAEMEGKDPFECYFDLLCANHGEGSGIYFSMSEEDLDRIILDPNTMVGSDGLVKAMHENGHPRGWAALTHAITYFHKQKGLLSLEEIIRKMTSFPAERLGLKGKGIIADGYDADLVLFNYDRLQDQATYADSNRLTDGIEYVIVGGQIVYHDKKLTGAYPGKLILREKA